MITLLSAAVMLSAVSCSKVEQSTLNSETLPVKITVTGHVRSIATDSHGSQEEPMVVRMMKAMWNLPSKRLRPTLRGTSNAKSDAR